MITHCWHTRVVRVWVTETLVLPPRSASSLQQLVRFQEGIVEGLEAPVEAVGSIASGTCSVHSGD